jgi:hypothetical protein
MIRQHAVATQIAKLVRDLYLIIVYRAPILLNFFNSKAVLLIVESDTSKTLLIKLAKHVRKINMQLILIRNVDV